MSEKEFVDYYELLQASPNASLDTIEKLFRYLTNDLGRGDSIDGEEAEKFSKLVEGFETLRDNASRASYDREHGKQKQIKVQLVENANCLDNDTVERHKMLAALYAKRRTNMRIPGVGDTTLEHLVGCSPEVMNFHIWYFKEKGWIQREESGLISITAEGVEKVEAVQKLANESAGRNVANSEA